MKPLRASPIRDMALLLAGKALLETQSVVTAMWSYAADFR